MEKQEEEEGKRGGGDEDEERKKKKRSENFYSSGLFSLTLRGEIDPFPVIMSDYYRCLLS